MSKEMVGGCCVCSDERGWTENPLVYCDGQGCTVAVHQACYGIVSVPPGPWFCRKCESQERAARVKCELCPSKEGALKRTDNNGWAHVVCALYIPEVRFGNVTTMEPIILQLIPPERFNRTCYICQELGKGIKTNSGACMQCNKAGCKQQFHVTCAQTLGLLCEEAGNFMDNVKYCGYCQHHNSKLKKGGNVKPIPPYKPIATEHDSSPEKDGEGKNSIGKKKSYLAVKALNPASSSGKAKSNSPSPDLASVYTMDTNEDDEQSGSGITLKIGTTSSHSADTGSGSDTRNKFTTSNFVETVVTQSEPVFGSETKTTTSPDSVKGKKRKSSTAGVKTELSSETLTTSATPSSTPVSTISSSPMKNLCVSLSQIKTTAAVSSSKMSVSTAGAGKIVAPVPPTQKTNLAVYGTGTKITIAASREDPKKSKAEANTVLTSTVPVSTVVSTNPTLTDAVGVSDAQIGKRPRSSSQEKGRKPKRPQNRRSGAVVIKDEPDSPPGSPEVGRNKKKQTLPIKEEKDVKPLATVTAPHMLGNQLNPASSMAQKMNDSLHQEVEAHSIYSPDNQNSNLVGPPPPRRYRAPNNDKTATLSAANSLLSLGNPATSSQTQTLEDLLERQWELGSQFLMEQAHHFDIASLLSCLHQLKNDNIKLEEQINTLEKRRDHLLGVNARLQLPLNGSAAVLHLGNATANAAAATTEANEPRTNGIDPHPYMHQQQQPQQQMHVSPSPPIRNAPVLQSAYNSAQARRPVLSQYQSYPQPSQQMPPSNQPPPSMGMRRDDHHQQL